MTREELIRVIRERCCLAVSERDLIFIRWETLVDRSLELYDESARVLGEPAKTTMEMRDKSKRSDALYRRAERLWRLRDWYYEKTKA